MSQNADMLGFVTTPDRPAVSTTLKILFFPVTALTHLHPVSRGLGVCWERSITSFSTHLPHFGYNISCDTMVLGEVTSYNSILSIQVYVLYKVL